ncbi:heme-dependent oxidative N-demethylase subunit alpha family protein [Aquidulcibacter paucihalophilus]|uniref:heme-dependent oxidative N-demethylase subunit alpha family protein n=1 Tax=Aquidulcibacter paucihalophilus TaxID=1978549 RepID=UPI0012FF8A01|nr:heme-dependent oxidative N-demethylase subunit alpha family protein [Aquidulcibacter paucihalophilus]
MSYPLSSFRPLPFEHGPPCFDVGLAPIEPHAWLMPDDQSHWIGPKNQLMDAEPDAVFASITGSMPGQIEAAALVASACGQSIDPGEPPLFAASRLVSDDLVLMEMRDGAWTNTALCLCSPTFFSAHEAIGKSLFGLHRPVPGGDPGLGGRISRVFSLLRDELVLERHNWTVQWRDARYTPNGGPLRAAAAAAGLEEGREALHVRVERQTIRRLPESGAVLFTIRIRLYRLADLLGESELAQAFQQAWHEAGPEVRAYKKWESLERHVAALLRDYARNP